MKKGHTVVASGLNTKAFSKEQVRNTPSLTNVVAKKRLGEEMISKVDDLPSLPTVVTQILNLIQDEQSNASNFEKYLRQDQGLTARLLRIVNSSFFGLKHKVTSISQAVVIIGYQSLKNLVLAASTSKFLEGAFPGYGFREQGLWQHSFMVASWSQKIAMKLGWSKEEAEEMFVAGLLHDIGKLVMSTYVTEHCQEMIMYIMESKGDVCKAESALMGVDHAEIGARIAQKWNFSNQLVNIIKYHHNIEESSGSEKEVSLINLVNYLLIKGQYGMFENFPIVLLLDNYCKQTLSITDENIEEYSREIHASAENWEEC